MELPPAPRRTRLPHVLAALYAIAIVYVSLEPFSPWLAPSANTPFFLFAPWPTYWTRYDLALNILAYAPLGFFLALLRHAAPPIWRIAFALGAGMLLSFTMETLQMYIPPRDASAFDLAANTAGALAGGMLATALARNAKMRGLLYDARARLFLPGQLGDVGVALLLLWLAAQVNPAIPLFAATFDTASAPAALATDVVTGPDGASVVVQAAASAFQLLGVGMFVALLLRRPRTAGGAVLLLIGGALLLKGMVAAAIMKPSVWLAWLKPDVLIGTAAGALLLPLAIALRRPAQVAICAVALMSSLGALLLAPEMLSAHAPLSLFDWRYGQLLNYNGLTRAALLVWPVLAAMWLFALAGRPGWGRPSDGA